MSDLLFILATWRLASLFVAEDGPYDIFAKLRAHVGVYYDEMSQRRGSNEFARVFLCLWCMSVWVGLMFAVLKYRGWRALPMALAYSAGAIVIESAVQR